MGWWDESIMGGDTPRDIEIRFNDKFVGAEITSDAVMDFIEKLHNEWGCQYPIICQATGFLMIQHGAVMSDELKAIVIAGIDTDKLEGWFDEEARDRRLTEFKQIVIAWDGSPVELPDQPGVFNKLFG